jgi:hypothetical protein
MKPYTLTGASVKEYSGALTVEFGDKAEDEEEINEDENTPKNHNILPKDPSEVGL